jgi:hypothetical protein
MGGWDGPLIAGCRRGFQRALAGEQSGAAVDASIYASAISKKVVVRIAVRCGGEK